MVVVSSLARRGVAGAGAAAAAASASASVRAARRPASMIAAARRVRRLQNDDEATATLSQRRHLSAKPAPVSSPASAAPASTVAAASGDVPHAGPGAQDKATSGGAGGGGGADELWIVGRFLEEMDVRLGAKQEKLRVHEVGVIQRYAAVISALDGRLEPREDDDFLAWLRSQGLDISASSSESTPRKDAASSPAPADPTEDDGATAAATSDSGDTADGSSGGVDGGDGGGGEGGAAKKRAEVERFLSAAAARLNALVAAKEEALFADRGDKPQEEIAGREAEEEAVAAAAAEGAVPSGQEEIVTPNMSDEELYQARLGAHRAMLCHCLSLLSSSLSKQQLKTGLSVEEVAAVVRSAYLADPEGRLAAIFPLFDTHGDGHLDTESVERAVDAVVLASTKAVERCYLAAARPALDKKAAAVMPATMKYVLWDVLEVPVKRRCAFAWADDRKQVGPDEWRISWEQFAPSRRKHFPELEAVTANYVAEFGKRRSAWHNSRKGRREAIVYGSALLVGVLITDNLLKMI